MQKYQQAKSQSTYGKTKKVIYRDCKHKINRECHKSNKAQEIIKNFKKPQFIKQTPFDHNFLKEDK